MCGAAARSYRPTRPRRKPRRISWPPQSRARGRSNPPGRGDLACTRRCSGGHGHDRDVVPRRARAHYLTSLVRRGVRRSAFGVRRYLVIVVVVLVSRAPLRYLCEWARATDARKRGGHAGDVCTIALSDGGRRVGSYDGKQVARRHTENQSNRRPRNHLMI